MEHARVASVYVGHARVDNARVDNGHAPRRTIPVGDELLVQIQGSLATDLLLQRQRAGHLSRMSRCCCPAAIAWKLEMQARVASRVANGFLEMAVRVEMLVQSQR